MSGAVRRIVDQLDPDMGRLILRKQCDELGLSLVDLDPADLPRLRKALVPAISQFLGRETGRRLEVRMQALEQETGVGSGVGRGVHEILERAKGVQETGEWDEARTLLSEAVVMLRSSGDEKLLASTLKELGFVKREQCDWPSAQETYTELRSLQEKRDHDVGVAWAELGLGNIAWQRGEYTISLNHFDTAIARAKTTKNPELVGETYILYGNVYAEMGRIPEALQYYDMALGLLKEARLDRQLARVHNNIGDIYLRKGDFPEAEKHFELTIKYAERAKEPLFIGWGKANRGEVYARQGRLDEAKGLLDEAAALFDRVGDRIGVATVMITQGIVARKERRFEAAEELMFQGVLEMHPLDAPFHIGMAYLELGTLQMAMKKAEDARAALLDARRIFKRLHLKAELAIVDKKLDAPLLRALA